MKYVCKPCGYVYDDEVEKVDWSKPMVLDESLLPSNSHLGSIITTMHPMISADGPCVPNNAAELFKMVTSTRDPLSPSAIITPAELQRRPSLAPIIYTCVDSLSCHKIIENTLYILSCAIPSTSPVALSIMYIPSFP